MSFSKKIFPFFFLLLVFKVEAQQIFQKTYHNLDGDPSSAKSFVVDANGNIYLTGGGTSAFTSNNDCLLMKADSNGTLQWSKIFGGTTFETGWQLELTADSNLIIGASTTKFDSHPDEYHPLLIKADTTGNMVWGKVYVDSSWGCEQTGLLVLPDGGFLLTGSANIHFPEYDSIPWYGIMIRLDSMGNVLWSKIYGADSLNCNISRVVLMGDGGFLSTGYIYSKSSQEYDNMLIRTDSMGNLQWVKRMILPLWDFIPYILKMYDSNYLLAGYSQDLNTTGTVQSILFKIDSIGDILWTKWYSSLFGSTILYAIAPAKDNGFIFSHNGFDNFVKIDSAGSIVFKNDFRATPFSTAFYKIRELTAGNFLVAGITGSNADVYIVKIDSTANAGCYQNNSIPFYSFDTLSYFTSFNLNTYPHYFTVHIFSDTNSVSFAETVWCNTATDIIEDPFDQDANVVLFPNPAENFIQVRVKNESNLKFSATLSDFSGRIISVFPEQYGSDLKIDIDKLKGGLYFIKVIYDGNSFNKKFLKL